MFTHIRPVKFNLPILNDSKAPVKISGLVIVKITKTKIIISLWPSYYISQNSENTISQTALEHYNQFISVRNEALRWL